jgi:molecular chaperone DnaK (HSP70)
MPILDEDICVEAGQKCECVIYKGTTLDAMLDHRRVWSTAEDYQSAIRAKLVARNDAGMVRLLGTLNLQGIKPALKGVPRIMMRIGVTADGDVLAEVCDLESGNSEQAILGAVAVRT